MRKVIGFLVFSIVLLPEIGTAQTWPGQGDRVRIRKTDGDTHIGTIAFASAEEVRLSAGPTWSEIHIPMGEIEKIETSQGKHRHFGRNFLITVASTSAAMGLISAVAWSPCTETGFLACMLHPGSRGEALTWGLSGGALLGLPLGLLVGLTARSESWRPALGSDFRSLDVGVHPILGKSLGFSTSLSFRLF